jgi:hypothetical protein
MARHGARSNDRGHCVSAHAGLDVREHLAVREQALHLKPQRLVLAARDGDVRGAVGGVEFAGCVKELFETLPPLRGYMVLT